MKKSIVAVALMVAMGSAVAGNNNGPVFGGGGDNDNRNTNTNLNSASAGASASNRTTVGVGVSSSNRNTNVAKGGTAIQGQLQGQLQGQVQGQDNDQNMTYNETDSMHYSGKYKVETNPSMGLGGISPTAPCAIPLEGTYSGVGIGVGLGTAYVDKGCERRELIRMGLQSGNVEANGKAAALLNRDLDAALAESDEAVASGPSSSERDVWAFQGN